MAKQDPCPHYFAAIDIGSNAVRMILGTVEGDELRIIQSWRKFLRLGADVFQNHTISPASYNELFDILKTFLHDLKVYPETSIVITATSAMRDAKNRSQIQKNLKDELGLQLNILTGNQEADYIREIVQHCTDWGNKQVIVGDLGGGSLEVSILSGNEIKFQNSFDYGVLRFSQLDHNRQIENLRCLSQELLSFPACKMVTPHYLILTGGNAKVLARLSQGLHTAQSPSSPIVYLSWSEFSALKKAIEKNHPQSYVDLGQMSQQQAEVLLPALEIFELLGNFYHCPTVVVPFAGFKEGVLLRHAQSYFPNTSLQIKL